MNVPFGDSAKLHFGRINGLPFARQIGPFMLFSIGQAIFPEFQLARNGIVTVGTVTGYKIAKNGTIKLDYEFLDLGGFRTKGRGYFPIALKDGTEVRVLQMP